MGTNNTLSQNTIYNRQIDKTSITDVPAAQGEKVSTNDESVPVVLLVDDTPTNLHLLIEKLLEEKFKVLLAESGESALERMRNAQPDIILLDVVMPGMNGFEACRRFKENPTTREIPILFLTALDETVDKVHGFDVGGVDYITKPLQVEEVMVRLNTHLTLRRLQQELQRQNEHLEERVQERTIQLQSEVEKRKRQEEEKHKLLDVLGAQSDQLRDLTTWLIGNQQQLDLADIITVQIEQSFASVANQLTVLSTLTESIADGTVRSQLSTQLARLDTTYNQLKINLHTTSTEIRKPVVAIQQASENPLVKLSAREREVLQLVVDGKPNTEIAELLYLSETTIRTHRSHILQKLKLPDTTALIKFAIKHQLTSV